MRYLGQDELTEMMGIGSLGEVRQGPDGNLYQWVEGVDGLGNPIGFWRGLRRVGRGIRRVARRALPVVQRVASAIPLPQAQAVAAGLRRATPILQRAGVLGDDGLGALYQSPNGTLYQAQGLREDELTQMVGLGSLGEVRQGPDGNLYQWVEGVDGLGNPIGFWRGLRRVGRGIRRVARRALPVVQRVASAIPLPQAQAVAAGLRTAAPLLRRAGVAGHNGLGALSQAPDGTLYQVEGLAEDEELEGLAQDEEMRDLAEDEELEGFAQDEELEGLAEDEELEGLAQDEELEGLEQGYIRQNNVNGLEAYVPEQPARTNWFVPPAQPPEKRTIMWEPLW